MIRVGILSDTHLPIPTDDFVRNMKRVFSNVDMILHAGDITSKEVLDYLAGWDLRAVYGNMDEFNVKSILPDKRIEEIEGRRIGIIHGWGGPHGIEDLVMREFKDVDAVVFGHSHVPLNTRSGGVMLFNPGSFRGRYMHPGSMGIMEIDKRGIRFAHMKVI
jgi:uncharacterized protein